MARSRAAIAITSGAGTNRNSASGSTNFLISQGHATRSTFTRSRVIHFIVFPFVNWLTGDVLTHRVDADLRGGTAVRRYRDVERLSRRREEAGAGACRSDRLGDDRVAVSVLLSNDIDGALPADRVNAPVFGIEEEIVRIAIDGQGCHALAGFGVVDQ